LAGFEPFLIVSVKLAVPIASGQCYESTNPAGLFLEGVSAEFSASRKAAGLVLDLDPVVVHRPKLFPLWADSANIHAQVNRQPILMCGATQQWHSHVKCAARSRYTATQSATPITLRAAAGIPIYGASRL
jgi:hypothetical protein